MNSINVTSALVVHVSSFGCFSPLVEESVELPLTPVRKWGREEKPVAVTVVCMQRRFC